jgi:CspA family cold shock protein
MEGYIKSYNEKKGYGFIETEKYGVVFIHKSGIADYGYFGLQKGDLVSFEIKETPKGKHAIKVKHI